jgi:hypothetical protein
MPLNSCAKVSGLAPQAVKGVLQQVSAVKLKGIKLESRSAGRKKYIVAHILICRLEANGEPAYVSDALQELKRCVLHSFGGMTPILIAPYISMEAQVLCRESKVSFLDLKGDAHLVFDEVFFAKRSLGHYNPLPEHVSVQSIHGFELEHSAEVA